MRISRICWLLLLGYTGAWSDAIPVRGQPLSELLHRPEFSAPASAKPLNAPSLSAELSARVENIPVRVGDRVKQGELLVELDCRSYQSRLLAAEAGLQRIEAQHQFARAQLARAEDLKKKQSISDELQEQRRSELLTSQAERVSQQQLIRQAQIDVERCTIVAPFDAVVTTRNAQVGALATTGAPLISLIQLDDLEVSAELQATEVNSLTQAATLAFEYNDKSYPLRLRRLLPVIDERTRTQEVRLSFTADPAPAGAAGRLTWQGPADELATDYLVRRDGRLGIFLLESGQARFYPLPDAREGQPVRLNLSADSLLITEGRQRLQDGDAVSLNGPAE